MRPPPPQSHYGCSTAAPYALAVALYFRPAFFNAHQGSGLEDMLSSYEDKIRGHEIGLVKSSDEYKVMSGF